MIEFYHHPLSSNAQLVRLVLEEKNLEWKDHFVDLQARSNLHADYLAINPEGLVPALVHDGHVLTESTVIVRYLDRVFPEPRLQPTDSVGLAAIDWWLYRLSGLQSATHDITYATVIHPQLKDAPENVRSAVIDGIPDPVIKARRIRVVDDGLAAPDVPTAMRYFKRSIGLLEQQLEGNYVTGTNLTLADIGIAPYLFRLDQLTLSSIWGGGDSIFKQKAFGLGVRVNILGNQLERTLHLLGAFSIDRRAGNVSTQHLEQ